MPLPPGTYDIRLEAWQTVFFLDDLEDSSLFEDVVIDQSVDVGLDTLELNDVDDG